VAQHRVMLRLLKSELLQDTFRQPTHLIDLTKTFFFFSLLKSSIPSTFNEPGYLTFWNSLSLSNLGGENCWLHLENSLTNNADDWSIFWVKGNLKKLLEINRISQSD
jgi:hypothetical protein